MLAEDPRRRYRRLFSTRASANMLAGRCGLSGIFGEPGAGAHRVRIGGLAAVDVLATMGLSFLITRYALGRGKKGPGAYALVFIVVMLVAVLIHEAFCVNTRLNAAVFNRAWPGPHPCGPHGIHHS
jgi:hypothetical protein